ncbi:hypothetical protein L3Q82_009212 [Scortum barcoo]|uniref:Uncharacterized protein n=1 Tax=Scortum barcoo TaxID=214431 RepID=A0ACB8WG51_9TELE|nr:hypothetical protein L3Q82_009212 [Scortum barcoo]
MFLGLAWERLGIPPEELEEVSGISPDIFSRVNFLCWRFLRNRNDPAETFGVEEHPEISFSHKEQSPNRKQIQDQLDSNLHHLTRTGSSTTTPSAKLIRLHNTRVKGETRRELEPSNEGGGRSPQRHLSPWRPSCCGTHLGYLSVCLSVCQVDSGSHDKDMKCQNLNKLFDQFETFLLSC